MFVADYMTSNVVTVSSESPLAVAADLMTRRRIHHLPVLDPAGRLVGILSDRDIRSAVGFDRTLSDKLKVCEAMTHDPVTITPVAGLDEALEILAEGRFGALPVVEGGDAENPRLVGILTTVDLLRALRNLLGLDIPGRRLEVALPHGCDDLARVFKTLSEGGYPILSAVASHLRADGREPSLYIRVPQDAPRGLERSLERATAILLHAEPPRRQD